MSIKVDMVPVVGYDEIESELNLKIYDFDFYNRADEDFGYFWLGTDIDAVADAEANLDDYFKAIKENPFWIDSKYRDRLKNDIILINYFRKLGYDNGVLIYVWY